MDKEKLITRAGELIAERLGPQPNCYCTLTTIDSEGYPVSTTISPAKSEGIRWITLCTGVGAPSVLRLRENPRASVTLNSSEYHIGLVGEAEICTDLPTKREMWYGGLANHFSGPEDENLAVIRFTTQRYSLFVDWEQTRGEI